MWDFVLDFRYVDALYCVWQVGKSPACRSSGPSASICEVFLETATPFTCVYGCLGLHGGFIVTESIWSRKPKILSENTTRKSLLTSGVHKRNSKFCMCGVGGVGVVMICVRMFIRIYPDEIRMAQKKCGSTWMWKVGFPPRHLRLMELLCGSFLPFCTALVYKVYFLGEVGEKQMWAERSEVEGRVLSIVLTSSEKWCWQVWAIGIKRKGQTSDLLAIMSLSH